MRGTQVALHRLQVNVVSFNHCFMGHILSSQMLIASIIFANVYAVLVSPGISRWATNSCLASRLGWE
jgi:C4-dicarboxylate transporter